MSSNVRQLVSLQAVLDYIGNLAALPAENVLQRKLLEFSVRDKRRLVKALEEDFGQPKEE